MKDIQAFQIDALSGVMNIYHQIDILYSITGILHISDHFESLACSFALYLHLAHQQNPVRQLLNHLQVIPPWSVGVLLYRFQYMTLWNRFKLMLDPRLHPKVVLTYFLRDRMIALYNRKSVLSKYILETT